MKITVTGATGNVGGRIVAQLLTGGHDVRAVIGPGETPPWRARKGLEVTIASFSDRAAIEAAATGVDAYFLMSPPSERQVEWQRTQVDAAVNSGVPRVVKLSAYDTGANSGWNMGRWHWDGELALQESGLPHAVLRPQYFQQNLLLDETTLRAGTLITYIPPGRSVGAVHAGDIADVAAALLTTAPLSGQIVVPTGPATITTDEAAAAISTALGTPISVDYVEPDRAWRELRAAGRPDCGSRTCWRSASRPPQRSTTTLQPSADTLQRPSPTPRASSSSARQSFSRTTPRRPWATGLAVAEPAH